MFKIVLHCCRASVYVPLLVQHSNNGVKGETLIARQRQGGWTNDGESVGPCSPFVFDIPRNFIEEQVF